MIQVDKEYSIEVAHNYYTIYCRDRRHVHVNFAEQGLNISRKDTTKVRGQSRMNFITSRHLKATSV